MADVFISYKSERRPAISHLARVIENYGYSVWFDYALMSGGSFSAQIERELRAARAVIVVWCSMSVHTIEGKTNWVVEEADLAKSLGTYLPVWLETVDPPLGFRRDEIIDIAEWNCDPRSRDLDRLIEQISIKVQRDPAINYKSLVAQSDEVSRSGHTNLATYPLDTKGAQLTARNREREDREKAEAKQIAENARREAEVRLAAQKALAEAQAQLEAEQRLKQEQEAADALAKAEQERLARIAEEEERQQKALEEAAAKLREEQRLKDEAEAARMAEEARLEAKRLERERLAEESTRPETAIFDGSIELPTPLEPTKQRLEPTPTMSAAAGSELRTPHDYSTILTKITEGNAPASDGQHSPMPGPIADKKLQKPAVAVVFGGMFATVAVGFLILNLISSRPAEEAYIPDIFHLYRFFGEWVMDQNIDGCSRKMIVMPAKELGQLHFSFPGHPELDGDYKYYLSDQGPILITDNWTYRDNLDGTITMQAKSDANQTVELSKCET